MTQFFKSLAVFSLLALSIGTAHAEQSKIIDFLQGFAIRSADWHELVGRNKCFLRIAPHVPALGRFIDIRRNALRLLRPTIFLYHAPLPQLLLKPPPRIGWTGAG